MSPLRVISFVLFLSAAGLLTAGIFLFIAPASGLLEDPENSSSRMLPIALTVCGVVDFILAMLLFKASKTLEDKESA